MSSVRKCDVKSSPDCQGFFSELEDGWQSFQAVTIKRDRDGNQISVPQMLDSCPACTIGPTFTTGAELEERAVLALERIEERLGRRDAIEAAPANDDETAAS